jgi:3-methyl-2-oxobutanoate hydroxymethyltransferase
LLGLSQHTARFVQNFMDGQSTIADGLRAFVDAVKSGQYPQKEHTYS